MNDLILSLVGLGLTLFTAAVAVWCFAGWFETGDTLDLVLGTLNAVLAVVNGAMTIKSL